MKLSISDSLLLVIDVQERIFATMHEQAETERNINRIINGAKALEIPIIVTEQYPKGLGSTLASIKESLSGYKMSEKISFSCLGDENIKKEIASVGKKQILVCGIEAHVCVYQTVIDLIEEGYDTHVVTDAVMSRKKANYLLALSKMEKLGANLTSVEMALFELQEIAKGETFKTISKIIR